MKKKLFLLSLFSVALLAGCNKSEEGINPSEKTKTVSVKFTKSTDTRAVDSPVSGGAHFTLNNVNIYLANGNVVIASHSLNAAEIAAGEYRFEQVSSSVNKVLVVANVPSGATLSTTLISSIEGYAYTAASQQSSVAKPGVNHLTLMGSDIPIEATDPDSDGDDYMEATVRISALVARIEMGTIKAGAGLNSITLNAVYVNNYFADAAKIGGPVIHASGNTVWTAPYEYTEPEYANDYSTDVTNTGDKCYAFQVFAGNVPHVVLRVSGEYEDGTTFTNAWVTFNKYNKGSKLAPDYITAMTANNIYSLGKEITINAEEITPFPEMGKVDFGIKVEVANWNLVAVTPEV